MVGSVSFLRGAAIGTAVTILFSPVIVSLLPLDQVLALQNFDRSTLQGSRVVICGASSGIGEHLVYQYAALGAHVALLARRRPDLERVADAARKKGAGSAHVIVADLQRHERLKVAVDQVLKLEAFGGAVDVLVLNHAVQRWGWLLPESADVANQHVGLPGQVCE